MEKEGGEVDERKMTESLAGEDEIVDPMSWQIGFVYVFNLIIGAGVLALPKAFAKVGWLLGLASLCVLAFISFITVTFVTESMSLANAVRRHKKTVHYKAESNKVSPSEEPVGTVIENKNVMSTEETDPKGRNSEENNIVVLPKLSELSESGKYRDPFDITVKFEMGEMASLFFNKTGVALYYVSICIYLYGSAIVYCAIIGKSMTTLTCDDKDCFDITGNSTVKMCKRFPTIKSEDMYRIMLSVFVVVICPFAYFDIKNTKLLQVFTTSYRWFSLISMIVLAFLKIGKAESKHTVNVVVLRELPNFFGVALYAFMCHHSIPAVTTPVSNKRRLTQFIACDFVSIVLFFSVLLISSVFAFPADKLDDVYTLNFTDPMFFKYLLQLFPILTLSASFPIYSIVLRENIRSLFIKNEEKGQHSRLGRFVFTTISLAPPLIVAYLTHDVGTLVNYTGGYAGAIIQYVVPAMLVLFGRRKVRKMYGEYKNKHSSPFKRNVWVYLIMVWYVVCLAFVTYNTVNHIKQNINKSKFTRLNTSVIRTSMNTPFIESVLL